jgi:hypothetical protein
MENEEEVRACFRKQKPEPIDPAPAFGLLYRFFRHVEGR